MSIQIVIRPHGDNPAAVFAPGTLVSFAAGPVCVGSAATCNCRLPAGPELAATLLNRDGAWWLKPAAGVAWTVNGALVNQAEALIGNGDEFEGAGSVLHFHRLRPAVPFSRRVDLLATISKLLILLIFVGEIAMFAWLPRQIQSARLWQGRIARQKAVLLLDDLRKRNAKTTVDSEAENAARSFVGQRLDEYARQLRRYQDQLGDEELHAVYADLQLYADVVTRLEHDQLFKEIPPLPVDAALGAVLDAPPKK